MREGQVLHKGLVALNWAVAVRHMRADTIAARRKTGMLSQVFKQVSNRVLISYMAL